jgi:PIN domain nuclease of toxin-antitoxin system
MAVPLLDTHAWIWWIEGDRRLQRRVRDTLDRLPPDARPCLSAISLWEVAMLVERGRVVFSVSLAEWFSPAIEDDNQPLLSAGEASPHASSEARNRKTPARLRGRQSDLLTYEAFAQRLIGLAGRVPLTGALGRP